MVTLNLTEEQCNYLYSLLDMALRAKGSAALNGVVDLHNVLTKSVQEANVAAGVTTQASETTEETTDASPE